VFLFIAAVLFCHEQGKVCSLSIGSPDDPCVASFAKTKMRSRLRQSNPTGNQLLFLRIVSSPKIKNISLYQKGER